VGILANQVEKRLSKDEDANASGIIINTCGWIDGPGFDIILYIIKAFSIDVVLVMNHDKLYSMLGSAVDAQDNKPVIVQLPSSGGVVSRVSFSILFFRVFDP
jgi:polyribonucleotide 5'-hydroxyl-kinase